MLEIPAGEVAQIVGAQLVGDPTVRVGPDVVIDSRLATPGCLFVAVGGDRVDGHDFAELAVANGATAILANRETAAQATHLIVADQIAAMSRLAQEVVRRSTAKVIGVTGSAGKTSTKDLIAQVLEPVGATVAPIGSMNNEIGVPLTALTITAETQYLVIEMGARGPGHISWLCEITPPQIGVVTNVGTAHVGEFGSVEATARAKSELIVAASEWAVLNADDPQVLAMSAVAPSAVATFSTQKRYPSDLPVWAENAHFDAQGCPGFDLVTDQGRVAVQLRLVGAHQVSNALAAATVGLLCGESLEKVAQSLNEAQPRSKWRMEVSHRADGLIVVNDAYNANPDSMKVALAAASRLRQPGGRLIAVLGDMLELGELAVAAHRELGQLAASAGVDELVAVGQYASALAHGFPGVHLVSDAAAASGLAVTLAGSNDVLLVKASRGIGLETVAETVLSMSKNGESA